MYYPHQFAIAVQDDRLRTAERRRLVHAAAREAAAAQGARHRRSTRRDIVRAFRPRAVAAANQ